ncbi:TetR/AcrR family transcriptional regulator, partial [Listeria monocytogenes]|nr:TetR/AcrR family transcriptional regulator [Listeria monocytogenes]
MNKKNSIIKGLFSVMNTYEFSMITVTQIAQEANIGRKTFYRYFKNKEEVLEEAIELLFTEYASK